MIDFRNKIKNKKTGFTLVELLVVISIISILTIVGVSSFRTVQMKSRDTKRKNDLNSISKALNMYYNDIGSFPYGSSLNINYMITTAGVGFSANVDGKITTYMAEMPTETATGIKGYQYSSTTGKSFKLFTNIENINDKDCLKDSHGNIVKEIDGYIVSDNTCIYGVSSSNIRIEDSLL